MNDGDHRDSNVVSFPAHRSACDVGMCIATARRLVKQARETNDLMQVDGLLREVDIWLDRVETARDEGPISG